jgi:hypothetical protein
MSGTVIVIMVVITCVMLPIGFAHSRSPAGKAKAARYCTKHQIVKPWIAGGPERLTWKYGDHRTPGNECDGPEHERVTPWW